MTEEKDIYKIEIIDLKKTDAGEYTAKLINKVGEATKVARLNISGTGYIFI